MVWRSSIFHATLLAGMAAVDVPRMQEPYGTFREPTPHCPVLARREITRLLNQSDFGGWIMGETTCCFRFGSRSRRAELFDLVAELARRKTKQTDVKSQLWHIEGDMWLSHPVDLRPLHERPQMECTPDVFHYKGLPAGTLVVDFANKFVGGGCFARGFVQEEQMVLQCTDLAIRLRRHRELLDQYSAVSYEGVHIDSWWPRLDASKREELFSLSAVKPCDAEPCTVFAVDAPSMRKEDTYDRESIEMLARKVFLIFQAARISRCPLILSGLLGGGAFRNNRPLVLLLHLLLQRPDEEMKLRFHHPVFYGFTRGGDSSRMEQDILKHADALVARLRQRGVTTLGQALEELLSANLPLSHNDLDLVFRGQSPYTAPVFGSLGREEDLDADLEPLMEASTRTPSS